MKKKLVFAAFCISICLISARNVAGFHGGARDPKKGLKPNIILIMADDLGYSETGCYGQKIIQTPNIDRLAREGMRFSDFYAASPVCAPSRCGLMTGKNTGHAYIRDNVEVGEWDSFMGQMPLKEKTFTLGTLMQQAGFKTAFIGKWGLGGPGSPGIPNKQGFGYFYGYLCQRQAHNYYPDYLWRNETKTVLANPSFSAHQKFKVDPASPESYKKYQGEIYSQELITDEASRFIREHRDSSFFLFLSYSLPHLALQVPEKYLDLYKGKLNDQPYSGFSGYLPCQYPRATYAAMISALDDYVGKIVASLQEAGIDSNTLILLTSDNGATFEVGGADPYFFRSNGPLKAGKGSLFEGGIRVPMIARWPGVIKAHKVSGLVCASWDFMATFADLTGIALSPGQDGLSLVPELLGRKGQKKHSFLYWEYPGRGGSMVVRMGDWKGIWKNLIKEPYRRVELYNLKTDTGEQVNVAKDHPEQVRQIMEYMSKRTPSEKQEWNVIGNKTIKQMISGKQAH